MPKKNSKIKNQYSGFVLTFEPERTQWLAERLYPDNEITESFSAIDWEFERRELVFLVLETEPLSISAMALMERMHGSGGSGKLKMRMSKTIVFDTQISEHELNWKELNSVVSTPERLKRTDFKAWEFLLTKIRKLRPEYKELIDQLILYRETELRLLGQSDRVARLNEQRDGLGLTLDIAQLDRSSVLKGMNIEKADEANSILDLLDTLPIQERSLLEHDARLFKSLLGEQPYHSAVFSNGADRSVRIHVVDQTDIETVLGIDLIIYNTCFDNFLLLQYKRMQKGSKGWVYQINPTSNLNQQLKAMASFKSAVASSTPPSPTLWSYRLNDNPFYFKFCEQFRPEARDDSLVPGITMCESHLTEYLALPESRGPKGGLSVGYHNCPRYLNNTEFIQLARVGWIGTGMQALPLLQKVLEANQKGGRAAMFAIIDREQSQSATGRGRNYNQKIA
ncbi:MAG: hypothetical protein D9V46_04680 [Deltaproteobacteria bacterium]|uniref:hypothetical protein n=1 Tax=Hydrosulfovibrio ferrireducens TaxID=2934181 RepID=UPI0012201D33|nr:MAG: hypothetical protein D9V46_04680 [Deltaproteobacteria bacterium]